jgi:putative toxin-antitoxin system antitoxin component (TIGR02293 family)
MAKYNHEGGEVMYSTVEAFGGRKHLGKDVKDPSEFRDLIKKGIPVSAGNYFKHILGLNDKDFAEAIGTSFRTFYRKKSHKGGRLSFTESDRLYRYARIFAFAVEVLGDEESAREWFHSPQIALEYRTPLEMMDTDLGAEEVEDTLGRIMHGVVL